MLLDPVSVIFYRPPACKFDNVNQILTGQLIQVSLF